MIQIFRSLAAGAGRLADKIGPIVVQIVIWYRMNEDYLEMIAAMVCIVVFLAGIILHVIFGLDPSAHPIASTIVLMAGLLGLFIAFQPSWDS